MKTKNYYFNIKTSMDSCNGYIATIIKKTTWDKENRYDETGINDDYLENIGFSRLVECEYEFDWDHSQAKQILENKGFIYNPSV